MTSTDLAVRSGYSRSNINKIARGATRSRAITLFELAEVLGVSPGWLAYGEGDME